MAYVARNVKVMVEGVEVVAAMSFNIAEGWVECASQSPTRYANQDCHAGDVMTSRLYGKIEIEDKE